LVVAPIARTLVWLVSQTVFVFKGSMRGCWGIAVPFLHDDAAF